MHVLRRSRDTSRLVAVHLLLLSGVVIASATPVRGQITAHAPPGFRPVTSPREILEPTFILALVGDEPIFSADLLPTVNQMVERLPDQLSQQQVDQQRVLLMRNLLKDRIDTKMLYLEFLRSLPADRRGEVLQRVAAQVDQQFHTKQVPNILERSGLGSPAELESQLRSFGGSLDMLKREFREQVVARTFLDRHIQRDPEVTYDELLERYRAEAERYEIPARVRWRKLTVLFSRIPDEIEAELEMVDIGNEVLGGAPFDAVARRRSQGVDARDAGYHDWTERGTLVSQVLEDAVFTLPVGRMSRILRDDRGLHIVEVLERQEAGRVPFTEAQDELREEIRAEKVRQQIADFVSGLRETTPIWTVFDDYSPGGTEEDAGPAGPTARGGSFRIGR